MRPRFVGRYSFKMFGFLFSERNNFNIPVPNKWKHDSNCALCDTTLVTFSYLGNHLKMSDPRDREHLRLVAEV